MSKPTYTVVTVANPPNHSLLGYEIVSENRQDGKHTLFMSLRAKAEEPTPAPRKRRARKPKAAPQPATLFEPSQMEAHRG